MCVLQGLGRAGIAPELIPEAVHVLWGFQCSGGVLMQPQDRCDLGVSLEALFFEGSIASHRSGGSICTAVSRVLP